MTFREWSQAYGKTIWSRLRYAWHMAKVAVYPGLVLADDMQLEVTGGGQTGVRDLPASPRQLLEMYDLAIWIYTGASRKADVIADLPWVLKREIKGQKDEVIKDHPARDFLWEPGPNRTWHDLIYGTSVFLDLCGRAYYEVVGSEGEVPSEIVSLYPQYIKVRIDRESGIVGYEYKPNQLAQPQVFEPSDVVWIRAFSPLAEYGEASPVRSGWLSAQLDINARKWNDQFFRRGASPETYLTGEKTIPRDERARIEKDFENRNQGVGKGRGVYFLPAGIDVKQGAISQREMQFDRLRQATREELMACLGVPPIWVGVETANYATARTQEAVAIRRVCIPAWNRIAARITQEILPRFEDSEGLYLAIDEGELRISEEDDSRHSKIVVDFQAGLISREEARERLGYIAEAKGDEVDAEANVPIVPEAEPEQPPAPASSAEKSWSPWPSVQIAAQRGLDVIAGDGDGIAMRVVAMAKKLAAGEKLSAREIQRIASWHERHEGDDSTLALLHGGINGADWSTTIVDREI